MVSKNKHSGAEPDSAILTRQEQILQGGSVVLSTAFTIGVHTVFSPCGLQEDGSYMTCHYAGLVLTALGVALMCIALMGLICRNRQLRTGLNLASLPVEVLLLITPGTLVRLCMMPDMHCRSTMRPAALLFGTLMLLVSFASLAVAKNKGKI